MHFYLRTKIHVYNVYTGTGIKARSIRLQVYAYEYIYTIRYMYTYLTLGLSTAKKPKQKLFSSSSYTRTSARINPRVRVLCITRICMLVHHVDWPRHVDRANQRVVEPDGVLELAGIIVHLARAA